MRNSPIISNSKLRKNDGELITEIINYRALVGSLQYLTQTRPDLVYAINQIAQFIHEPRTDNLAAVKRIIRYVKGTFSNGLHFTKTSKKNRTFGYCDADFAGDPYFRKSTTGLRVFIEGNLVT